MINVYSVLYCTYILKRLVFIYLLECQMIFILCTRVKITCLILTEIVLMVARRPPEICSEYLILVASSLTSSWLPRNLRRSLKLV